MEDLYLYSQTGGTLSFDAETNDWTLPNGEDTKTPEEMHLELKTLEDEIQTLRQVLGTKERRAADLRKRLGLTPMQLIGGSWYESIRSMSSSVPSAKPSPETMSKLSDTSSRAMTNTAAITRSALSSVAGMASGVGSSVGSSVGGIKNSRLFSSMYGFKAGQSEEDKCVEPVTSANESSPSDQSASEAQPQL